MRLSKARRVVGGLCRGCSGAAPPRREEVMMEAILSHVSIPPSGIDTLTFGGATCNTKHYRPDALWIGPDYCLVLELDDNSHAYRQPSCELAKVTETAFCIKTLMKRDNYRVDTLRVGELKVERAPTVACIVNEWLHTPDEHGSDVLPNIGCLFYGSGGAKHIEHAIQRAGTAVGILTPA